MTPDDEIHYPPVVGTIARRTGHEPVDVAHAIATGRTAELFDTRGRVTGAKAVAIVEGWRELFDAKDAEQSRRRLLDIIARRPK